MKRILIAEDDKMIRGVLMRILQSAGFEAEEITLFEHVAEQVLAYRPNLLLLDLNLPHESGFSICKTIKQTSAIPVLVLTSRDQLQDELQALKLGADEFLTKPFRKERLLARIEHVLKRYEARDLFLERGGLMLDQNTYTLYAGGKSVVLPQNQGRLLCAFFSSPDLYVCKEELCTVLWGTSEFIDENALQVNMTRLKKTLRTVGMEEAVKSVRGKGYRLEVRDEA